MVYLTWWIGTVCCVLVLVHVRINNLSDTVKFQKLQIDGLNKNLLHLWDEVNNNRKDLQKGIDAAAGTKKYNAVISKDYTSCSAENLIEFINEVTKKDKSSN